MRIFRKDVILNEVPI